ncbi:MAG: hypothetical protein GXO87_13715 [Chlorobi bacterium]|nr:hypothetical protein [Chlorobiota bacterium]
MTFSEIIKILLLNKKKIVIFSSLVGAIILLLTIFVIPIKYTAEAVIFPPEKQNTSGIQALMGGNSDFSSLLGFGAPTGDSQLYAKILKSRTINKRVLEKSNLMKFFDAEDTVLTVEKLQKLLDIEVTKEKLIKLRVTLATSFFARFTDEKDSVRNLSAKVANAFYQALDDLNKQRLKKKATDLMRYFQSQIDLIEDQLRKDEDALREFQEKNRAISIPEQLDATLQAAAKIKSEILYSQIQLETLRYNLKDNSQRIKSLEKKIEVLNNSYESLKGVKSIDNPDYLPEFENIPRLSLEFARLKRNVKVSNSLYILLKQQFYHEQFQASRNVPTISILDKAIPPRKSSSPRVVFSTVVGGFFAFLFISAVILYNEQKKNKEKTNG